MQELHRGKQSVVFPNFPAIEANAAIVGKKEGEGPLREDLTRSHKDTKLNQASWEKAERASKTALELALGKASLNYDDLDVLFAGDLLNQCISSSFAVRDTKIPFLGLYGACSTMAESLLLAASFVNAGYARRAGAITSSPLCLRRAAVPLSPRIRRPAHADRAVDSHRKRLLHRIKQRQRPVC